MNALILVVAMAIGTVPPAAKAAVLQSVVFKDAAGAQTVSVVFDTSFGTAADVKTAELASNYAVIDFVSNRFITVKTATVPVVELPPGARANDKADATIVELVASEPLDDSAKGRYAVIVQNVTFSGTAIDRQTSGLTFGSAGSTPETIGAWARKESKGRDDSDLFFSGEVGRTADTKFVGSIDTKIRIPFARAKWGNRVHVFAPEFDLQASGDASADANTAKLGLGWSFFPVQTRHGFLSAVRWTNNAGVEADARFKARNALLTSTVKFLPVALTGATATFDVQPIFAVEIGRRMHDVSAAAASAKNVLRTHEGVLAHLSVEGASFESFDVTVEYGHRRLHRDEFSKDGELFASSHDWWAATVELKLTKFASVFAGFEDGQKPPAYSDVNRHFKFGLILKSKFKR